MNKKPEITKGEWVLDNDSLHVCPSNNKSGIIADVFGRDRNGNANARAISAVPEMIDALMDAHDILKQVEEKLEQSLATDATIAQIEQSLTKAGVEI